MEHSKKAKIILLPTDGKSKIHLSLGYNNLFLTSYECSSNEENESHHLYFVLEEKPKEGDYYFYKDEEGFKYIFHWANGFDDYSAKNGFKIIASTESLVTELHKGQQYQFYKKEPEPSIEFLNYYISEYNKGNIITEVNVEYEHKSNKEIEKELGIYGHDEGLTEREYDEYIKTNSPLKLSVGENNTIIVVMEDSSGDKKEKIYTKEDIKNLINEFKQEELPNRNSPYHHEAEIDAGLDSFIEWLNRKYHYGK